jgi:hypothetical protein
VEVMVKKRPLKNWKKIREKGKEKIYIKKGKRFKKLGLFRKAGFRFIILKVIQSPHKVSCL